MKIQWLGHASFLLTLAGGIKIITDPYDESVGYPLPGISADIVTVSHQHFDHNAINEVKGTPEVIQEEGEHTTSEIKITGIPSYHDPEQGARRGNNIIFVIEAEGLKVGHLGDLGHNLEKQHLDRLRDIDVLLVPVGGHFTIDAAQAQKIVEQLRPGYAVPMHYKTSYIQLPISDAGEFLAQYPGYREEEVLNVEPGSTPGSTQVIQLKLNQNI